MNNGAQLDPSAQIDLMVISTKLDNVIQRLDKINGSIGRLQDTTAEHERNLVVLNTEKDMITKLFKPTVMLLCIAVAGLLGHQIKLDQLLELFK